MDTSYSPRREESSSKGDLTFFVNYHNSTETMLQENKEFLHKSVEPFLVQVNLLQKAQKKLFLHHAKILSKGQKVNKSGLEEMEH